MANTTRPVAPITAAGMTLIRVDKGEEHTEQDQEKTPDSRHIAGANLGGADNADVFAAGNNERGPENTAQQGGQPIAANGIGYLGLLFGLPSFLPSTSFNAMVWPVASTMEIKVNSNKGKAAIRSKFGGPKRKRRRQC